MRPPAFLQRLGRSSTSLSARRCILDAVFGRLDRHGASGMVSYSSAGQDRMIDHLIGAGSNSGFYVDVGAWQPKIGSNTYSLYRRGWSGITVEPRRGSTSAFRRSRPRDQHLEIGIASAPGTLSYKVARSANSSVNSFDAPYMATIGVEVQSEYEVQVDRLDNILDRCLGPGGSVQLLTIDTEGSELTVLKSNDWERYRPNLVLIEDVDEGEACRFLSGLGYEKEAIAPVLGGVRDHLYADPQRPLYRDIQ